jgi:hypothetical protein
VVVYDSWAIICFFGALTALLAVTRSKNARLPTLVHTHCRALTSTDKACILLADPNKEDPVVVYDSWAIICFFGALTALLAVTRSENARLPTFVCTD